nr:hypothetical protein [Escherichia coli]
MLRGRQYGGASKLSPNRCLMVHASLKVIGRSKERSLRLRPRLGRLALMDMCVGTDHLREL